MTHRTYAIERDDQGLPTRMVWTGDVEMVTANAQACQWSLNDIGGDSVWETQCGHAFEFTTDGPAENGFRFCGYCGGPLVEVRTSTDDTPEAE